MRTFLYFLLSLPAALFTAILVWVLVAETLRVVLQMALVVLR